MKITAGSSELHPEGWFNVTISGEPEEGLGKFGPTLKWPLTSKERTEEGQPFPLTYMTGCGITAQSKLGALIVACGQDLPDAGEEFDTADLVDGVFNAQITHIETEKGTFARVTDVRREKVAKKGKKADPFEDE